MLDGWEICLYAIISLSMWNRFKKRGCYGPNSHNVGFTNPSHGYQFLCPWVHVSHRLLRLRWMQEICYSMKTLGSQENVKIPVSPGEIFVQEEPSYFLFALIYIWAVQCCARGLQAWVDFYTHSILLTQCSRKWDMEHVKVMQMNDVCGGRLVESSH